MSFLRKGLLSNYITQYDASKSNPRWVQVSGGSAGGFEDRAGGGYKKAWTKTHYDDSGACVFRFFRSDSPGELGTIFKFSLPPQGIEITYPQRIFETKTFGGSVFEDYGNDTVAVTIQGTTANSDIRSYVSGTETGIGAGSGAVLSGTGLDELNAFQNLLFEYGKQDNLLKKTASLEIAGSTYIVFVKEFSIRQSKDNPLVHTYTISLLGRQKSALSVSGGKLGYKEKFSFKERLNSIVNDFNKFVSGMEEALSVLEKGLSVFEAFSDICAAIRGAITRVEKAVSNLVNQILAYADAVSTSITEVTSIADLTVSSGVRVGLGTVDKALVAVDELMQSADSFLKFFEDFSDTYGEMSSDILEHWDMTTDEIVEIGTYIGVSSKQKVEALRAEIQQTTSSSDVAVEPGGKDTDDGIVFVYGTKTYTLAANDTWESLALKFYGDASKASLLSSFNNQKLSASGTAGTSGGSSMPAAGTTAYIPVLEAADGFDGTNEVYNPPDTVDIYGHDIEISSDGDIGVLNGDLAETDGAETLLQAVVNRLSTSIGSRIRDDVYGIKTSIGSAGGVIQLAVTSSIEATLMQDPRIKSVDGISFTGDGDKLRVEVTFTDINDIKEVIGGTF